MHTAKYGNLTFAYNSDLSGDIIITMATGDRHRMISIWKTELFKIADIIYRHQFSKFVNVKEKELTLHEWVVSERITLWTENNRILKDSKMLLKQSDMDGTVFLPDINVISFIDFITERLKEKMIAEIEDMDSDTFLCFHYPNMRNKR